MVIIMKTRVNKPATPNAIGIKLFGKKISDLTISQKDRVIREYQAGRKAYNLRLESFEASKKIELVEYHPVTFNPFKQYHSGKTSLVGCHGMRF